MAAINNICFNQIDKTGYCPFYQRIAFISLMIESNNSLKIESGFILQLTCCIIATLQSFFQFMM